MSSVHDNEHDKDDDDEYEWVEPFGLRMMREDNERMDAIRRAANPALIDTELMANVKRHQDMMAADKARMDAIHHATNLVKNHVNFMGGLQRLDSAMMGRVSAADSAVPSWESSAVVFKQLDFSLKQQIIASKQQLEDQMRFAQGWTRVHRKKQHVYSPLRTASTPAHATPSPTDHEGASPSVVSPSDTLPSTPAKRGRGNPNSKPWLSKERYEALMHDYVVNNQKLPSRPAFAKFVAKKEMNLEKTWFTRYAKKYFGVSYPELCSHFKGLIAPD